MILDAPVYSMMVEHDRGTPMVKVIENIIGQNSIMINSGHQMIFRNRRV